MIRRTAGFTVPETIVACLVLATLATAAARMLGALSEQRRAVEVRASALAEAANQLERVSAERWDDLTDERLSRYALSADAARQLPEGQLTIQASDEDESPAAKRLVVEIRWRGASGEPVAPVQLTAWFYRPASDTAPEGTP